MEQSKIVVTVVLFFISLSFVQSRKFTDEEYLRFPKLFHLDDYDRCLNYQNGIYCAGKFQIYTDDAKNQFYDLIQEYSQDESNYNRTFVHRGICLNTRCPSTERNTTARFERCVDQWARTQTLRARIHSLHYCHTSHDVRAPHTIDTPRRVFLYAMFLILLMNLAGTVYDYTSAHRKDKNAILMAWSVPANWNKFVTISTIKDPRYRNFNMLEGIKGIGLITITMVHSSLVSYKTYQFAPRVHEKFLRESFISNIFQALTSFGGIYLLMSSFLTTTSVLISSESTKMGFQSIPRLILKKFIRLFPMNLFGVAFAATWWVDIGDGPMWPILVGTESNSCRHKFWYQCALLQNFFKLEELCILNTWIYAVEFQLYAFSLFIILGLLKYGQFNLRSISLMYVIGVIITFLITYTYGFKPAYLYSTPESIMPLLVHEPSFTHYYIQPYSHLLLITTGFMLGYLNYHIKIDMENKKFKRLFHILYLAFVPTAVGYASMSIILKKITGPIMAPILLTVDKIVTSLVLGVGIYSGVQVGDKFTNWQGWQYISKISYSFLLIHWQVTVYLVARQRNLFESGIISTILLGSGTIALSLFPALALTILVEYPMQKFISKILIN